jgi:hypothetical protein
LLPERQLYDDIGYTNYPHKKPEGKNQKARTRTKKDIDPMALAPS